MAEQTSKSAASEKDVAMSGVAVPEHLHKKVVDYVNQLKDGNAEISAYMLSLGGSSLTGTHCHYVDSTKSQMDAACADIIN